MPPTPRGVFCILRSRVEGRRLEGHCGWLDPYFPLYLTSQYLVTWVFLAAREAGKSYMSIKKVTPLEFWFDMYTLLCLKWITNKVLLNSS